MLNFFKRIIKFFTLFLIFLIPILIIGRNHLIFGTLLSMTKWLFFSISIIYTYYLFKKKRKKNTIIIFSIITLLIPFETAFTFLNKERNSTVNEKTAQKIKVMSQNLLFNNRNHQKIIKQIKEENPDILAVQEMTYQWQNSLDKHLTKKYPFQKKYSHRGTHGTAIYSKFPITKHELLNKSKNLPFAQLVEIQLKNRKIQLINAHLSSPGVAVENPDNFLSLYFDIYNARENQMKKINDKINHDTDAQILLGDLNTVVYEPLYRIIQENWVDAYLINSTKNARYTFPNNHSKVPPILALDYVFLKGKITSSDFKIIKNGSSDHLGIVSNLLIEKK